MVIQRIQTVYLLVAAVLLAVLSFLIPVADLPNASGGDTTAWYIRDIVPVLIVNLVVVALLLIDIFLFKNLPFQMKVVRVSMVLLVASAILEGYTLYTYTTLGSGIVVYPVWSAVFIVATFVAGLLALHGMNRDYKLLRSYDRLR